ncbi:MAG TPA: hypothetical protein VD884_05945 [Ohtaekwangia sp.]|nr:hypothetical protein [Ohtaekwangia sp.]
MTNKDSLAKALIEVETLLNNEIFKDFRVGSLLSKYNEYLFRNRMPQKRWLWVVTHFMRFFVKGLLVSRPSKNLLSQRKILLSKLADKNQCNRLIDPLKAAFQDESILYTPGCKNELYPLDFIRKINILFFLQLIFWLIKNTSKITYEYTSRNIPASSPQLCFHLMIQLVAAYNWHRVLNNTQLKIIVVDFDRDAKSSALITASRVLNIKTITLVHGVINPPFGYFPVIADQIWLWSNFQKNQLEKMAGRALSGYKIVGSPIVELFKRQKKVKHDGWRVGVAVNPMGAEINKKFLANIVNNYLEIPDVHWIIKLHPSMNKHSFKVDINHPSVSILASSEITNEVFFNTIDLLIVGNSGLGFEAVANDIPIAVIRHSDSEEGHDFIMVHYFRCPDISSSKDFISFFKNLEKDEGFLNDLLVREKAVILNEYYSAIDVDAEKNIIKALAYELGC